MQNKSNMAVEGVALLKGLKICLLKGFHITIIELDSLALLNMLMNLSCSNWSINALLHEDQEIFMLGFQFQHMFHEDSMIVDTLANLGSHTDDCNLFFDSTDTRKSIIGLLRLDKLGISSVRFCKPS
ncbi:hypothetical protein ACH5RR_015557 [Cinchona calisaya]|uniref:RNase H type-1 domain-containing protein n=1 Tax=Cinchona calisaya TaxID=153742 RepID=A0ABD2ZYW1_9GENT